MCRKPCVYLVTSNLFNKKSPGKRDFKYRKKNKNYFFLGAAFLGAAFLGAALLGAAFYSEFL